MVITYTKVTTCIQRMTSHVGDNNIDVEGFM